MILGMDEPRRHSIDVAVWDCFMFPGADAPEQPPHLYTWEARLPPGYYRIEVDRAQFPNSQRHGVTAWYDLYPETEDRVDAVSALGNWVLPRSWLGLVEIWIAIVAIDEPPRGEPPPTLVEGSWSCPWSPDRRCRYDDSEDYCVYCGLPDERK